MLQEIANQKGVSCRAQGWKVHLCAAQLLQLVSERILLGLYHIRAKQNNRDIKVEVVSVLQLGVYASSESEALALIEVLLHTDFMQMLKTVKSRLVVAKSEVSRKVLLTFEAALFHLPGHFRVCRAVHSKCPEESQEKKSSVREFVCFGYVKRT